MTRNPMYLETTEVPAEKTEGEIFSLLKQMGARHIASTVGENQATTGMQFVLVIAGQPYSFKMPVRTEGIFKMLTDRRKKSAGFRWPEFQQRDREQANRIAWRQALRWLQAQFAMTQSGMAEASQVFLPYMQEAGGRTVYEIFAEERFKALPPAKEA